MRINSGTKVWPKLPFADTRFNFPPTSRTRRGKRLGLIQGYVNVTAVKAPFFVWPNMRFVHKSTLNNLVMIWPYDYIQRDYLCWWLNWLVFLYFMMSQSTSVPKKWKVSGDEYYLCSSCGCHVCALQENALTWKIFHRSCTEWTHLPNGWTLCVSSKSR